MDWILLVIRMNRIDSNDLMEFLNILKQFDWIGSHDGNRQRTGQLTKRPQNDFHLFDSVSYRSTVIVCQNPLKSLMKLWKFPSIFKNSIEKNTFWSRNVVIYTDLITLIFSCFFFWFLFCSILWSKRLVFHNCRTKIVKIICVIIFKKRLKFSKPRYRAHINLIFLLSTSCWQRYLIFIFILQKH